MLTALIISRVQTTDIILAKLATNINFEVAIKLLYEIGSVKPFKNVLVQSLVKFTFNKTFPVLRYKFVLSQADNNIWYLC